MTITLGQLTDSNKVSVETYTYYTQLSVAATAVQTGLSFVDYANLAATSTAGTDTTIVINPDTNYEETVDTWTGKGAGEITGCTRGTPAYAGLIGMKAKVTVANITNKAYINRSGGEKVVLYITNGSATTSLTFKYKPAMREVNYGNWYPYTSGTAVAVVTYALIDSVAQRIELPLAKCDGEIEITVTPAKDITLDVGFDTAVPVLNTVYPIIRP